MMERVSSPAPLSPGDLPRWMPRPVVPVAGPPRPPLVRPAADRVLGGVAAGLAAHLGRPIRQVRAAFVLGMFLAGAGAVLYLWLWALVPSAEAVPPPVAQAGPAPASLGDPGRGGRRPVGLPGARVGDLVVGGLLLLAGASLLAARFGLGVPVQLVLPVLVVLGGALLAYSQLDEVERARWTSLAGGGTRAAVMRGAAGLALVLIGVVLVVVQGDLASAGRVLVAAVAVLLGVGLVLGAVGAAALARPRRERPRGSASRSGPRSPPTCTTRCCRPSR